MRISRYQSQHSEQMEPSDLLLCAHGFIRPSVLCLRAHTSMHAVTCECIHMCACKDMHVHTFAGAGRGHACAGVHLCDVHLHMCIILCPFSGSGPWCTSTEVWIRILECECVMCLSHVRSKNFILTERCMRRVRAGLEGQNFVCKKKLEPVWPQYILFSFPFSQNPFLGSHSHIPSDLPFALGCHSPT